MKPALPMTAEDFAKSDEELGRWLFDTWCAYQAETHGVALDEASDEWVALIRTKTLEMDTDKVENVPLESAVRKAARGKFGEAGKMLRAHMLNSAHAQLAEKYAPLGIEQTIVRKRGGHASAKTRGAKASDWQAKCIEHAKVLLATGTAPHELAGKCANRFKRSPDTIRRVLIKAGVK
jgi:hypothetical protein